MSGKISFLNYHTFYTWADTPPQSTLPPVVWFHSLVRIIIITIRETGNNKLSLRSGALTYTILLSMVPILAMSTAVVKGLGGGDVLQETVYGYLDTLEQKTTETTPNDTAQQEKERTSEENTAAETDMAGHLRSAVDKIFDYVNKINFAKLGTIGMLGIFLTVILVLNHVETAMNTIWKVEAGRSILRKVTDYLTLMVVLPIALIVAFAAGAALKSQAITLHLERLISASWMQSLLLNGVPIICLTFALYAVYLFFPNTRLKMIPTFIGALIGGTLWFITQNLYIGMQIGVAKYNAIYGSFATLPLFLIWVYCGWFFVLIGAQVAYAIQNNNRYRLSDRQDVPAQQLSAAFDIMASVSDGFNHGKAVSLEQVAGAHPDYREEILDAACDLLIRDKLIHHSEETGNLMPSRSPDNISPQLVINAIFGQSDIDSTGGRASSAAVAGAQAAFIDDENRGAAGNKDQ